MFSRKNYEITEGVDLPVEWRENVAGLLNQNFQSECEVQKKSFDLFGKIYQDEVLVIVSWLDNEDFNQSPVTMFLSADIFNKKNTETAMEHLVEIAGLFFDEYFNTDDWSEFEPNWKQTSHKKNDYYYKITRENIALSLAADKILDDDTQRNQ